MPKCVEQKSILIENSTWNNVGDGFYQFPIYYLLKSMYGNVSNVAMIDGPINRAFRLNSPSKKRFKNNAFNISKIYDGNIYIFSGPIFRAGFLENYASFIEEIKRKGADYLILSSHSSLEENSHELSKIISFLQEYPPLGLSSRDRYTFDLLNPFIKNCYDGLCCAFYSYILCPLPKLKSSNKYITLSFYKNFEPNIYIKIENEEIVNINIQPYRLEKYSLFWKYLRHFEFLRNVPSSYDSYEIIRPNHGIGTSFINVDFSKPNSYLSFNPLSYLSLYQGTSLTISDRVHSCVVTLAAGKPVVFYSNYIKSNDRRPQIFERAPISCDPRTGAYVADLTKIESEFHLFRKWIERTLVELISVDKNKNDSIVAIHLS
ncbi:MAG: polysaccharide pyruvyl transferase family protein [Elainellaceae cyanobacterium]